MKKAIGHLLITATTAVGMSTSALAQIPTYTPGPAREPTVGIRLPIGKCINMGNMLEAPNEGEWGRGIADDDFQIIKAAGFDTVRIPIKWSAHALTTAPYTIDPTFMARVKRVVALAEAQNLGIMINVHHYTELMDAPAAHTERLAALWKQIAAEFSTASSRVWFELLNEPTNNLTNANLLSVLNPSLAEIRKTNPTRPVIIGGQWASSWPSLKSLELPNDPYVVPTIHYYDPFEFTHQGAHWVSRPPKLGRTYGTARDIKNLNTVINYNIQDYINRTGRVPFVGEYGAIDHPEVPLSERIKYYQTVSSAFAQAGMQTCAWSYTNTFRLREQNGGWLPGIVEAIKTTTNK
jgi:endoglucanase